MHFGHKLRPPPGAGKRTLAVSYLADKKIHPLWYRLDETAADPATLFLYLSADGRVFVEDRFTSDWKGDFKPRDGGH